MSFGGAMRVIRGQIQKHLDLYPLFAALGVAGSMSVGIMYYTSTHKADVSWNRWFNPDPYNKLDWNKHQQKLLMGIPTEREFYQRDDQILSLRQKIYGSGEYQRKDAGH